MKVLEAIQRGSEFLARKGVETPRLEVELLLAHLLGVPRLKLYLDFERALNEAETVALRELVKRRGTREPLQQILGTACFCGLEIAVNRHVLVPRPETELLAERAWGFIERRAQEVGRALQVLDFGTGSGCLAVVLAVKCPGTKLHALDVSPEALAVARENAARHGAQERIVFHQGDGLGAVPAQLTFDLLLSNPPYIATSELEALPPEVRDYEPRRALDGGPDGLDFYRQLAGDGAGRLVAGGRVMVELGAGQARPVSAIFQGAGWEVEAVEKDYAGWERIFVARR